MSPVPRWEYPHFLVDDLPCFPVITESLDEVCHAVTIPVDAGTKSGLNWKLAYERAEQLIAQGKFILWDLRLGLFDQLCFPLSHQSQFLTLGLGIDHFIDKLWKSFHNHSLGVVLYRGTAGFTEVLPRDELLSQRYDNCSGDCSGDCSGKNDDRASNAYALFCRNVAVDYLHLLCDRFSNAVPLFALLDFFGIESPMKQALLSDRGVWSPISPIIAGAKAHEMLRWEVDTGAITTDDSAHLPPVAVCVPDSTDTTPSNSSALDAAMQRLNTDNICYRLIPENLLIVEWEGLDELVVDSKLLDHQGLRKLQGFVAAGGTVIEADSFN